MEVLGRILLRGKKNKYKETTLQRQKYFQLM
jgi:hypothetical protein